MRFLILALVTAACGSHPKPVGNAGSGSAAAVSPSSPAKPSLKIPQASRDVFVIVNGSSITINGTVVSGTPMVTDFEKIFGPPDRTWDSGGANKVHTWDKIGLLVYEPYDGRCVSATFPYKAMTTSFTPKTLFAGSITLDGKPFTPALDLAKVKAWPGATQPYSGASIVFDRDEFHVFTIQEQTGATLDLVELSFWQRGKERPGRKPIPPPQRVVGSELEEECRGGDITRCTSLALAMQTGANGRKNIERAFELAKLGCAGGDAFACLMIGNMYDVGRGTAANKTEARASWKRACTLGYKAACDLK